MEETSPQAQSKEFTLLDKAHRALAENPALIASQKMLKHSIAGNITTSAVSSKGFQTLAAPSEASKTNHNKFRITAHTNFNSHTPLFSPKNSSNGFRTLNNSRLKEVYYDEKKRTELNRVMSMKLPSISTIAGPQTLPVIKILIDSASVNPFKFNPSIPLEFPTKMNRYAILREIMLLQLRFPELHTVRFDISDLFEMFVKIALTDPNVEKEASQKKTKKEQEVPYEYIYSEWLRIYQTLAKQFKYMREVFISYNLNYLYRTLKLDFTPESLHLEESYLMPFEVFKQICDDMKVQLDEYQIMCCFYLSTRSYKNVPCIFSINHAIHNS